MADYIKIIDSDGVERLVRAKDIGGGLFIQEMAIYDPATGAAVVPSVDYTHDASLGTLSAVTGPTRILRGVNAFPAPITVNDRGVLSIGDFYGRLLTLDNAPIEAWFHYCSPAAGIVSSAEFQAVAPAGVGKRYVVTDFQAENSHQTLGAEVFLRDGAGGPLMQHAWAQQAGGGKAVPLRTAIPGTANTGLYLQTSVSTPTNGVIVNIYGYILG